MQVSPIFQRHKSDTNKQDFENKLNLTCQAQSTPKTIGIFTKVFCTSGPNLVVLAQTGDELLHGQAQNGVNFDFEVKFDLEGQGQSPPKTIEILTKVFYTFIPNLAILAWTGPELSRRQASDWRTDWHTHTRTHTQTQAMTIPEGQNWPRVKMEIISKENNRSLCTHLGSFVGVVGAGVVEHGVHLVTELRRILKLSRCYLLADVAQVCGVLDQLIVVLTAIKE